MNKILIYLILYSILLSVVFSYSVIVKNDERHCFVVQATIGVTVTGSFEVISPNPKAIIVTLIGPSPDDYMHYESRYRGTGEDSEFSEGSFLIVVTKEGDYTLCITNGEDGSGDGEDKLVAFNLRSIGSNQEDYEYSGIQSELLALRQGLEFLKDHQSYMNQREDVHQETLESINTKLLCWTILEAVILLAMSLWQIAYIRSFFETKRRL